MKNCTMKVSFNSKNKELQKLFNSALEACRSNIQDFCGTKVLVEGAFYKKIWLETQPMGGAMFAKHNIEVALNNQNMFMKYQREDGRLPASIFVENDKIKLSFMQFQGYCFPTPALHMYYLVKKDNDYLMRLYNTLERFDNYLWKNRDSDNDGCLESWCVYDTGDDNSVRYGDAPKQWPYAYPPKGIGKVPFASMDVMGFSVEGRRTLSKISRLLDNGRENYWEQKAEEVRKKIFDYLWDDEKKACYDRDCDGNFIDILIHNNLRVMYYGGFSQYMADEFVKNHLLNEDEFWTPFPFPSIALNDPAYRVGFNDWSGQPMGLTFQRAIDALENYGYYAEVGIAGKRILRHIGRSLKFVQQYDPMTGEPSAMDKFDGESYTNYGPSALGVLEYIAKMYGVFIGMDEVLWSGLQEDDYTYEQKWGDDSYLICSKDGCFEGFLNGKKLFKCSCGARIITDYKGNIKKIIGISNIEILITIKTENHCDTLVVKPNEVIDMRWENE